MEQADYQRLQDMLIRHEGLRLKPYKCPAGHLTIGVGRNLEANGISEREAMTLLENDINWAAACAASFDWFPGLSGPRQAAIIDMVFNLGPDRFRGFRRMIGALARGDYAEAAREAMDSKWATQVGARAVRVTGMIRSGEW